MRRRDVCCLLLSDEMFFKSVWKVSAELSVLDIFKLFRRLLEYTRYERAEITAEFYLLVDRSLSTHFLEKRFILLGGRETRALVLSVVVFITSSKERELCEEEEEEEDDGCRL